MYLVSVLATILLASSVNGAETTNATCTADPWLTNDQGKDPCQLAVILEGACFNGNFILPALPSGSEYEGPPPDTSNICQCSSVTYSVVQACATCQQGSITPWEQWIHNCLQSQVAIGSYPLPIPDVRVPAWAYLDVSVDNIFDPLKASAVASLPESSLIPRPTTSATGPSTTNSGTTSTSSGSVTLHASKSKSSNHTGAIVGGIIGSLAGIVMIGIGAFIIYRRQRKSPRSQPRSLQEKVDMTVPHYNYTETYSLSPPKLYDPSDPSTFPKSPVPTYTSSFYTGTTSPPPSTMVGHRPNNSSISYSGFPEV